MFLLSAEIRAGLLGAKLVPETNQTDNIYKEARKPVILDGIIQCYNRDWSWIQTLALIITTQAISVRGGIAMINLIHWVIARRK